MSTSFQNKRISPPGHIKGHHLSSLTRWIVFLPLVAVGILNVSGCSVYMAANQPGKKDLGVLEYGTPRQDVVAELGTPIWSEKRNQETVEIHKFKQGYSKPAKLGRALFHAIADVASIGVWEIPGTLIETVGLNGTDTTAKVSYDAEGRVQTSDLFDATKLELGALMVREGTIGVVLRPTAPDVLLRIPAIPAQGRLAHVGRGAARGAKDGALIGVWAGILCPIGFFPSCAAGVAGAVLGSIPGAIYGAATAEPAPSWDQAEPAFQMALADLKIQETMGRAIQNIRGVTPNSIILLTEEELTASELDRSYPALSSKGMNTVVDLSEVTVELHQPDRAISSFRRLVLTARCRLIRTVDGAELDSRLITDQLGGTGSVAEWADQHAEPFHREVTQAAQRLAGHVFKELFSTTLSSNDVHLSELQSVSR
jgi:hypothetical protein